MPSRVYPSSAEAPGGFAQAIGLWIRLRGGPAPANPRAASIFGIAFVHITSDQFAVLAASAVFAGGAVGLILQHYLPDKFTTGGPRDMIGAVVGLLTLLSALVLGLLIWTAYGVYANQSVAIQTIAAKVLQLDLALSDLGPQARDARLTLRDGLSKTIDDIWLRGSSRSDFVADNFSAAITRMRAWDRSLEKFHPTDDQQSRALAEAKADVAAISQTRLQMSFALSAPVSLPLMSTVVGWAVLIFTGFGLMSKGNPMSLLVAIVGALALASAFHLILDLSYPYEGAFRVSAAPLEQVLAVMGKE